MNVKSPVQQTSSLQQNTLLSVKHCMRWMQIDVKSSSNLGLNAPREPITIGMIST